MKRQNRKDGPYKVIARYLHGVKVLNEDIGGSSEVSQALDGLCRYLAKTHVSEIEKVIYQSSEKANKVTEVAALDSLDADALDKLVRSVETPRRVLEEIAIWRFGVPSGSMRSFPNVGILREKILNLIDNERAHTVIGAAAKRSAD